MEMAVRAAEWRRDMIGTITHNLYQKAMKKGKGSILRSMRIDKGWGRGLIAGSIVLLAFSVPFSISCFMTQMGIIISVLMSAPGLLLLVLGIVLKCRRDSSWLSYYQKMTGYSEGELAQIDRELTAPSVELVICRSSGAIMDNFIACYLTENYVVINGFDPYIRRLEDIIAVAFSDSTDHWYMACLSKQDKEVEQIGLFTDSERKEALCKEIMQELYRRNPGILCGQEIVCEGRHYILERDGAELLRLYKEGRKLESANEMSAR